mgnify:CR=1 FL=1
MNFLTIAWIKKDLRWLLDIHTSDTAQKALKLYREGLRWTFNGIKNLKCDNSCVWRAYGLTFKDSTFKRYQIFFMHSPLLLHIARIPRGNECACECVWIRNEMNCDIVIYYRFVMNPKCIANEYFTLYIADCFELIVKMFTRAGSLAARNWNKFCNFLNWKIILMFFLFAMHWIAMSRV